MLQPTTISQKWKVTIPKEYREELGMKPGLKVNFVKKNGNLQMNVIPNFLSLRGIIKTDIKYNKKEIEKIVDEARTEEWIKKMKRSS